MISVRDIYKSYSSAGKGRAGSEVEVLKGVNIFHLSPHVKIRLRFEFVMS